MIERGSKPLPDGKTTIEGIQIGIDSEKTLAPLAKVTFVRALIAVATVIK